MINILVTEDNRYTIDNYLENRGSGLVGVLTPITYEELPALECLKCNHLIFSDLDLVSENHKLALRELAEYLSTTDIKVFNQPGTVLDRFHLLRCLFEKGINPHNVYRTNEPLDNIKYPVFIRHKDYHKGPITPLIHNIDELHRHLLSLRVTGHSVESIIIVEFVNTITNSGFYKKYSALKIGDKIIPRHLGYDKQWNVKANGDQSYKLTSEYLSDWTEYVMKFPHEEWVRDVFNHANIDYGRIDYGEKEGRLIAWEINLNPDYGRGGRRKKVPDPADVQQLKLEGHKRIFEVFHEMNKNRVTEIRFPKTALQEFSYKKSPSPITRIKRIYIRLIMLFPGMKGLLQSVRSLILTFLRLCSSLFSRSGYS